MVLMRFRTAPAIAVASLLAACAGQPQNNAALDAAQQRLAQLELDPSARQYASAALSEAEQSLGAAHNAYSRGETTAFNHDLFMADRALATAEAQTQNEAARQHLAQLSQNRDQILLQARNTQLQQQGGLSRAVLKFARQASRSEQATRPWRAVQDRG